MENVAVARLPKVPFSLEVKMLVVTATILTLAVVVLYPIILLLINTFVVSKPAEPTEYGLSAWQFALSDKGMLLALWNTVRVAVVTQLSTLFTAILFAWLIARTNLPGGQWVEFFFWVAFFLPTIALVQAWILLFDGGFGLVNQALMWFPFIDEGPFDIFSFWGIVATHFFTHAVAIKVMLLTPAFRSLDATLEEASTVTGASSLRTLARVTVPVLTPTVVTILVLSLVHAFRSVEIELVLGMPVNFFVFGSKVFDLATSDPPMHGAATALGTIVMLFMFPLIVWHRRLTTRRRFTTVTSQFKPQVLPLRGWRWPAFALVAGFGFYITVVPACFLLMGTFMKLYGMFDVPSGAWTLEHWRTAMSSGGLMEAVRNTLYMAMGGATVSVAFFSLVAYALVRIRFRFRVVADTLTWIPQTLPGIVLVLAWFWIILQTPFLNPLFGTIWALILVSGVSGMTLSVQVLKASVMQLGTELEESSEICGASWERTFWKIVVPLMAPTLVVVWVLNFVFAASGAVMPALLSSVDSKPLALLQLEYILGEAPGPSSVVGLVLLVMVVAVAVMARVLGFRVGLNRAS